MSIERMLITFFGDGSIRGIASYANGGSAEPMTAETAAALLPHAALLAQVQALQAELTAAEGAQSRIAELEAQIAALTTTADRSIHKAYLRAALASIDRLVEVDAAVQAAGSVKWELWANATTISQDDPDVAAIAAALDIDLDVVFAAARGIRGGRG